MVAAHDAQRHADADPIRRISPATSSKWRGLTSRVALRALCRDNKLNAEAQLHEDGVLSLDRPIKKRSRPGYGWKKNGRLVVALMKSPNRRTVYKKQRMRRSGGAII